MYVCSRSKEIRLPENASRVPHRSQRTRPYGIRSNKRAVGEKTTLLRKERETGVALSPPRPFQQFGAKGECCYPLHIFRKHKMHKICRFSFVQLRHSSLLITRTYFLHLPENSIENQKNISSSNKIPSCSSRLCHSIRMFSTQVF